MPEDVFWEELESLGISVPGILQLRSGDRDQDIQRPSTNNALTLVGSTVTRNVKSVFYN